MKFKKPAAIISLALVLCLFVPLGAMAANGSGIDKAVKAASAADIVNLRGQIRTLNKQIVDDKVAIAKDLAAIAKDIAGAKGDANIAESPDYKTVVSNIDTIKTDVKSANTTNYKDALGTVRGNNAAGAKDALNNVITLMNKKLSYLDAAKALADTTKATADTIATVKQADLAAWQDFHNQATALKQTIDTGHQQVASLNDTSRSVINQIVATVSSNKDILSQNTSGLAQIETELAKVKSELTTEYDGKVVAQGKQYDTDRKNKEYSKALDDLNAIIALQSNRVTVMQGVQAELTKTLDDLNSLVGSGGSSTPNSGASSNPV